MIRDVVVELSSEATTDFAVSVASVFRAHLAGLSFLYESVVLPVTDMAGIPINHIEAELKE